MNAELYTLIALAARYWFALLMILIVARAFRTWRTDSQRGRMLRAYSAHTGCVGRLVPTNIRRATELPIPREAILGAARRSDIRLRVRGVRGTHLHLEARDGGLWARPVGGAPVSCNGRQQRRAFMLRDGDLLGVGPVALRVELFEAAPPTPEIEDPFLNENLLWNVSK